MEASSVIMADAQALKQALRQAVSSGFHRVWAESDSTVLIQSIYSSSLEDVLFIHAHP